MYALFARIAEDELEVPDESDPCDVAKTTVVIIKVRDLRTAWFADPSLRFGARFLGFLWSWFGAVRV